MGEEAGVHGVRRPELPEWYWKTLERAYKFLTDRGAPKLPKGFPPLQIYLVTDGNGEAAPVLVNQISKQGLTRQVLGILIQLPVRNPEPAWDTELAQGLSAVVHEISHALNMQVLPLAKLGMNTGPVRSQYLDSWEWFDEGMAVAAEAAFAAEQLRPRSPGAPAALPVGNDWRYFALDWVDYPERSLNDARMVYQAGLFVRFLERRMGGSKFLHEVWAESARVWDPVPSKDCTPLAALERTCRKRGIEFCNVVGDDVFASGYCFESYFFNDPLSKAWEPEVFARFKERAVTRTWRMESPAEWPNGTQEKYSLPGLACRYFRFIPPPKEKELGFEVIVTGPSLQNLKAELALAFAQSNGGHSFHDAQGQVTRVQLQANGNGVLAGKIQNFSNALCDHAVLVVTNCDIVGGPSVEIEFSVAISADLA